MIGQRLLHYEILDKLGEGGMGVVYRARDTHLDRFVAIKVLPPERVSDSWRKARFVQEAKAASALNHPNIITIHDISADSGHDFIAMEYVAGKTLGQLIPRKGMRLNQALTIAAQIADALSRAHAAGIVHRDLKPSNIMVDEHGVVKLLDFGLAKLAERGGPTSETATIGVETDEGCIVGTAAYMSPEQAEGKPVDARSDIFSFGAVLYEMTTGRCAFQRHSKISTLAAVIQEEPEPLPDEVPRELRQVVSRCLRKDANRRYQHMGDVRMAMDDLKDESTSGRLSASGAPALRSARARKRVLGIGLGAALAAAAAWLWFTRPSGPPEAAPGAVPLTSFAGDEASPSFSPDGTQVAFQWNGERQDNWHIFIKQIGLEAPSASLPAHRMRCTPPGRRMGAGSLSCARRRVGEPR